MLRIVRNPTETETMTNSELLTDAANANGYAIVLEHVGGVSSSNARRIPYDEVYRQHTGLYETPVQNVQRAADDEAARAGDSIA